MFALRATRTNVCWRERMRVLKSNGFSTRIAASFLFLLVLLQLAPVLVPAQNLGGAPATNKAVQGQTAAQPEGAFLNLVNWVGNVIALVGAALCVVMAIITYTHGRGVARWAVAPAGLLMISGLTRLIEFWISQGTAGTPEGGGGRDYYDTPITGPPSAAAVRPGRSGRQCYRARCPVVFCNRSP